MRIHILGASGSGTTTLAADLAKKLGLQHFDSDDYFWINSEIPFQKKRERQQRKKLLADDLKHNENWILSGSICGWGDDFIEMFDLVVYLWLPAQVRLQRLEEREIKRHGDLINLGGLMYQAHKDFMLWASKYDHGGIDMRSKVFHESWLRKVPCKIIKIQGDFQRSERLEKVMSQL